MMVVSLNRYSEASGTKISFAGVMQNPEFA